jgi:hypothetical protein
MTSADIREVLAFRSEVERFVESDLIKRISLAVTPALEAIEEAYNTGDMVAVAKAIKVLRMRCDRAGLITDSAKLF